jgi:hypothetical protein
MKELGDSVPYAVLAVVSRDGRAVIASGLAGDGVSFSVGNNALFTCLHTDSTTSVPAAGQITTRQFFWFLEGSLADLLRRAVQDLALKGDR